jgi:hypothetical protein
MNAQHFMEGHMRSIFCLTLLLTACGRHEVRCDAHLTPINPPAHAMPAPPRSAP